MQKRCPIAVDQHGDVFALLEAVIRLPIMIPTSDQSTFFEFGTIDGTPLLYPQQFTASKLSSSRLAFRPVDPLSTLSTRFPPCRLASHPSIRIPPCRLAFHTVDSLSTLSTCFPPCRFAFPPVDSLSSLSTRFLSGSLYDDSGGFTHCTWKS